MKKFVVAFALGSLVVGCSVIAPGNTVNARSSSPIPQGATFCAQPFERRAETLNANDELNQVLQRNGQSTATNQRIKLSGGIVLAKQRQKLLLPRVFRRRLVVCLVLVEPVRVALLEVRCRE